MCESCMVSFATQQARIADSSSISSSLALWEMPHYVGLRTAVNWNNPQLVRTMLEAVDKHEAHKSKPMDLERWEAVSRELAPLFRGCHISATEVACKFAELQRDLDRSSAASGPSEAPEIIQLLSRMMQEVHRCNAQHQKQAVVANPCSAMEIGSSSVHPMDGRASSNTMHVEHQMKPAAVTVDSTSDCSSVLQSISTADSGDHQSELQGPADAVAGEAGSSSVAAILSIDARAHSADARDKDATSCSSPYSRKQCRIAHQKLLIVERATELVLLEELEIAKTKRKLAQTEAVKARLELHNCKRQRRLLE